MTTWLIIVTGVAYGCVAAEQAWRTNWASAVVYAGYAFSNIGLYILTGKA